MQVPQVGHRYAVVFRDGKYGEIERVIHHECDDHCDYWLVIARPPMQHMWISYNATLSTEDAVVWYEAQR